MASDSGRRVDGAVPVDDFTPETIGRLAGRILDSRAEEDFVYREAELDDLWRIVETATWSARDGLLPAPEIAHLDELLTVVRRAHDLVGHGHPDADPVLAAAMLRAVS